MAPSKSKDAEKDKLTRIALVSDDKVHWFPDSVSIVDGKWVELVS
jgi:hypothetical protein